MKNSTNLGKTAKNRSIKALIFDLDNTVFDTDPIILIKGASFLEVVSNFPVENEDPILQKRKSLMMLKEVL